MTTYSALPTKYLIQQFRQDLFGMRDNFVDIGEILNLVNDTLNMQFEYLENTEVIPAYLTEHMNFQYAEDRIILMGALDKLISGLYRLFDHYSFYSDDGHLNVYFYRMLGDDMLMANNLDPGPYIDPPTG